MKYPKHIYLQVRDDDGLDLMERTWSEEAINDSDIKYTRVKEDVKSR